MKRQRRKRSTRRRGLQHIGDVLSNILTDIDHTEANEANEPIEAKANVVLETAALPVGAVVVGATDSLNTF